MVCLFLLGRTPAAWLVRSLASTAVCSTLTAKRLWVFGFVLTKQQGYDQVQCSERVLLGVLMLPEVKLALKPWT